MECSNVRSSSPILIPSQFSSNFKKYNASTPLSISQPLSTTLLSTTLLSTTPLSTTPISTTPISTTPISTTPISYQYHSQNLFNTNISNTTTSRFSFNESQETVFVKSFEFSKNSKSSTSITSTEASFLCAPCNEIMSTCAII